ncbi:MAG: dethiobiotin synthase [Pseudomonadota bacterium]
MAKGFFITGTDTEVGKSWCTLGLMAKLQQQGHSVVGMKPIASGCTETPDGLRNEDALLIQQQSSTTVDYEIINPYSFLPAIAPHIAAAQAGQRIKLGKIIERFIQLRAQADYVVVEGVGGWQVPLNENETLADLAVALQLPVILVVGLRLGCINHALLSAESIRATGCTLAGWIANTIKPQMAEPQQTIDAIAQRIDAPLLGVVPQLQQFEAGSVAAHLTL